MSRRRARRDSDTAEEMEELIQAECDKKRQKTTVNQEGGNFITGDEEAYTLHRMTLDGKHQTCVFCDHMTFFDPSYHDKLGQLIKIARALVHSGKRKSVAYQEICDMYNEQIYQPLKAQEELRQSRLMEKQDELTKIAPVSNLVAMTVESVAYHFENDDSSPLVRTRELGDMLRGTLRVLRMEMSKVKDPESGKIFFSDKQLDQVLKLSRGIESVIKTEILVSNAMQKQ